MRRMPIFTLPVPAVLSFNVARVHGMRVFFWSPLQAKMFLQRSPRERDSIRRARRSWRGQTLFNVGAALNFGIVSPAWPTSSHQASAANSASCIDSLNSS